MMIFTLLPMSHSLALHSLQSIADNVTNALRDATIVTCAHKKWYLAHLILILFTAGPDIHGQSCKKSSPCDNIFFQSRLYVMTLVGPNLFSRCQQGKLFIILANYYRNITWGSLHLKSLAKSTVSAGDLLNNLSRLKPKEISKIPLWGESIGDQWIPPRKA